MPQLTKADKKATEAAERANNARNAGVYRKNLYPQHLIDPIQDVIVAARQFMKANTRPFGDTGKYLLPNRRIMTYLNKMGELETKFWQEVTVFLQNYSNALLEAQQQQGALFNAAEYPDTASLKAEFGFRYPIQPFPTYAVGDAVSRELDEDLLASFKQKIKADAIADYEATLRRAVLDLRAQVERIIKQTELREKTRKDGRTELTSGKIYDSLTETISQLTSVLADLQFGGSAPLQKLAEQIDIELTVPAESLRDNPAACKRLNEKAQQILAAMEAFV